MDWHKLLSTKRFGLEMLNADKATNSRTQFQRDFDRILFSSSFRRLQNKTQVFPLPRTIFVHNRLTHSLEVSSVGKSIGHIVSDIILKKEKDVNQQLINEIGTIVAAGCLAHDLGNPPYGHSGEDAISGYFKETKHQRIIDELHEHEFNDLTNFEGNANALRLLTHQFKGRRRGGFALTYTSLASIIKYPYDSFLKKKKYGYFQSEKDTFLKITNELGIKQIENEQLIFARHPLVYLVEAADDICYQVMDLEDAHKLKIISTSETKELFLAFFNRVDDKKTLARIDATFTEVSDTNEQIAYLRALVINLLVNKAAHIFEEHYEQIMEGNFSGSLISNLNGNAEQAMIRLQEISLQKIYRDRSVIEIELAGYKIIGSLLDEFINALWQPKTSYSRSLLSLIPEQFSLQYDTLYLNIRSILDYISAMTDEYALNLYRKIKGISLPDYR